MTSIERGISNKSSVTICDDHVAEMTEKVNLRNSSMQSMALSSVGEMYDIDGDGKLDEAEQAMRDLDKTGRGYLTNDKVYELMIE